MLAPQVLPPQHPSAHQSTEMDAAALGIDHHARPRRKRKADVPPENNERLSKRLSLLNLEHNGLKLYVPVENPLTAPATAASPAPASAVPMSAAPTHAPTSSRKHKDRRASFQTSGEEMMQLDDTKHKVYIYDLDDELSSESEPEDNNGRLMFLPDVEKHLKANRIPQHIIANPRAADVVAGRELILYSVPSSLTVPEEKDSVRKAIIESRARAREKQKMGQEGLHSAEKSRGVAAVAPNGDTAIGNGMPAILPAISEIPAAMAGGMQPPLQPWIGAAPSPNVMNLYEDAMEID